MYALLLVRALDEVVVVVGWGQPPSLGHKSPRGGKLGVPVAAIAPFAALVFVVALSSPAGCDFNSIILIFELQSLKVAHLEKRMIDSNRSHPCFRLPFPPWSPFSVPSRP